MNFWPFRRRKAAEGEAREDLNAALWEADRAIKDAEQLRCRADAVNGRLERTWERNHIAEAVRRTMRGLT